MAWYDTLISGANTMGNLWNAASPLINTGAAIYDRNQTRSGISDAFNAYRGYADRSLNTLGDVYGEARTMTAPYRDAGVNALGGYQNLLNNPGDIVNQPGYQFRFDQGAEAQRRNQAATGYRGSGNQQIALTEYGQNYATSELDRILARYLPVMQAGQNATGQMMDAGRNYSYGVGEINRGLGEAAGGTHIGQTAASSEMLRDILGLGMGGGGGTGNPLSAIGAVGGQIRDLMTGGAGAAGAGAAGAGAAGAGAGAGAAGAVGAGTALAGHAAQTFGVSPGTLTGISGATPYGVNTVAAKGATNALSPAASTASASAGSMLTGLGYLGLAAGALKFLQGAKNFKGGAAESAKTPKFYSWLKQAAASDPTGKAFHAQIAQLVEGRLWAGESNGWVVADLMKTGAIGIDSPVLYSSKSLYSPFDGKMGTYVEAKTYGLTDKQAEDYDAAMKLKGHQEAARERRIGGSDIELGGMALGSYDRKIARAQAVIDQFKPMMTKERQKATAQTTYQQLRSAGYTGDLTKLETYLGMR